MCRFFRNPARVRTRITHERQFTSMPHTGSAAQPGRIRRHLVLTGILQGIGCRPTIYRLATRAGLVGWVINTTSGVILEIEGTGEQCDAFQSELPRAIPFPGRIDTTAVTEIPPCGEQSFRIEESRAGERSATPIPPDVAVCPACVDELFTPSDPRYLYPFITCTLCGPRFTVVRSFPYDRERTSMADFTMCSRCEAEYHQPADRRFHSQTNSCSACGPRLWLTDPHGAVMDGDPIPETIRLLMAGKIIAVKGIGGFHLACNALDYDAVACLRERKGREEKPFAVMMPDLNTVRQHAEPTRSEETLLCSPVAPIVLLPTAGQTTAPNVAPLVSTLGVMLPYAPVHHLLFRHPETPVSERPSVLVMTSGNRSEEPIARANEEAWERLADLADAFLVHNREIVLRADDSIVRHIAGKPTVFRRSRGLVPAEHAIKAGTCTRWPDPEIEEHRHPPRVILAAGGDMKSALAVAKGHRIIPGPHIGDLASPVAQDYFRQSAEVLTEYLEARPDVVAVDPHPEYFSARLARDYGTPALEIYHHHAHAAALLFEHDLPGPAVFAVFDGTGYGMDGGIWGGEFLVADFLEFTRHGFFSPFPLPGGEAAIRRPLRILAGLLGREGALDRAYAPLFGDRFPAAALWLEAAAKGLNAPFTSSVGRVFDAAAAAIGFTGPVTFEGEAAMWLEGMADLEETGDYPVRIRDSEPFHVDSFAILGHVAHDMLSGVNPRVVAMRFHNSIAAAIHESARRMAGRTGIRTVGLTGGCFQNKVLTERAASLLENGGFQVLLHENVPPNDGGIALGQAVAALARLDGNARVPERPARKPPAS